MTSTDKTIETIIVGGGPVGIELAIALQRAGASYLLLEAQQIGHAFSEWAPHTHFYSTPEHVALAGIPVHNLDQMPITGEQYLAYLRTLVEMFDLKLRLYEPVSRIQRRNDGFEVHSDARGEPRTYRCRYVVLATGGMARPRRLNIPGEDLPHVHHRFRGPHPYFRTRVLIVGGRNSALEAALRCWRGGARVAISYRRAEFDTELIKPHLAVDMSDRLRKGEIEFWPSTVPAAITPTNVILASTAGSNRGNDHARTVPADFVILAIGFEAEMRLFAEVGVVLRGPERAPAFDPRTMETNVSGLFVAGTAAGGTQSKFTTFISTSHDHVGRIVQAITGSAPKQLGTIPARNNAVTWEEIKAN